MEFFNAIAERRVKRTVSPDDPMSIVEFEDDHTGPGIDTSFVLDGVTRTLRVVDSDRVTKSDIVLDFNDSPDEDPVCILTRNLGFLEKHNARMRIAVFGDCFLVILYAGQIFADTWLGVKTPYRPGYGSYDPNALSDDADVQFYTVDTLPDTPYKDKGHHGFFNIQYTYYEGASMNACIGPWLSENAEGTNVIETIMLPEFYEALKQTSKGNTPASSSNPVPSEGIAPQSSGTPQPPKHMEFYNLTDLNRVARRELPYAPRSIITFEDALGISIEEPCPDSAFVVDKATRTLRVVSLADVTEDMEVFDFNEDPDDVPDSLTWVLTSEIGLKRTSDARMRLAVFGDYFLVALFDGEIKVRRSDGDWSSLVTPDWAPDPNWVFDPDKDVKWFTPDTLPYAPYKYKGPHDFFNIEYMCDCWNIEGMGLDYWYSKLVDESFCSDFAINPEFYEALKRKKAQHKMDAEATQTVLRRSSQNQ